MNFELNLEKNLLSMNTRSLQKIEKKSNIQNT